ncbi:hypothetical protein ZIOFF_006898 [Zingiber officinale]|uniref:Uncharacterized protein n=1 Tax=Zingiber officinale TaxID=94328 RepID=A0A8J5LW27_ZINOF|nr:hypothetical protein ZIOFF_006898 [Zingiber officinale]
MLAASTRSPWAMAWSGSMAAVALMLMVAITAEADASSEDPQLCYCPCMKDQCMTIEGATREVCAAACDQGCRDSGAAGQPNHYEFCGF